jgi:hypothetical protein
MSHARFAQDAKTPRQEERVFSPFASLRFCVSQFPSQERSPNRHAGRHSLPHARFAQDAKTPRQEEPSFSHFAAFASLREISRSHETTGNVRLIMRAQERKSVGFCRPAGARAAGGTGEPGLTPGPILCRASGAGPWRPDDEPVTGDHRFHASTGKETPPRACLVLRGFAASREIVLPFPHPLKPATRTSPPRSVTLREVLPGRGTEGSILPS